MTEENDQHNYDARITALEVNITTLVGSIRDLKDDVDSKFASITTLVRGVGADVAQSGKTDWKAYFGGLAVLLVIIGFVGNGYVRDQERTEAAVQILSEKYNRHDAANGIHYSLREQVLNNAAQVKDNLRTHEAQTTKMENDIDQIRSWQEKHANRSATEHTRAEEKIWALERQVFK